MSHLPHIVIVGCGFGGLEAGRTLRRHACRVTIVDRSNHHLFQPLLYQAATAGLGAPSIAAPIRHIFRRQANVTVLMKDVAAIDPSRRCLRFDDDSTLDYDALIVAAGASHSFFGNDAWQTHAFGLKTLADAMRIRERLLLTFEQAERMAADGAGPPTPPTFVVVGAGPTGVEMAGTIAEICRHTLAGEFRHIDPTRSQVLLLEGGPRVLPTFPDDLSERALRQLERLGVHVRLQARVTDIQAAHVQVGDDRIASACTIWAAGVQASPLAASLGVPLDRAGRVPVQADLSIAGLDRVFVVGDMAAASSDGRPVPGVSPAAKQMGRCAARNALAALAGGTPRPFRYVDYGSLATIGRKAAVVQVGPLRFAGLAAWAFWLFVHVYFLIGFKNRLLVLAEWAWSYATFGRSARIVWPDPSAARERGISADPGTPAASDRSHPRAAPPG